MSNVIFYAVESTGLPVYQSPSESDCQPHLVQIGAIVCTPSGEIVDDLDLIVSPDGWDIPQVTIDLHKITKDHAIKEGIGEQLATEFLIERCKNCLRVSFSESFPRRMVRIATKRYGLDSQIVDAWNDKTDCVCLKALAKGHYGGKAQKLDEVYLRIFGKPLVVNSALDKAKAYREIYFALTV